MLVPVWDEAGGMKQTAIRTVRRKAAFLFISSSSPALFGYCGGLVFENCFCAAFTFDMDFVGSFFCFVYGTV